MPLGLCTNLPTDGCRQEGVALDLGQSSCLQSRASPEISAESPQQLRSDCHIPKGSDLQCDTVPATPVSPTNNGALQFSLV